MVDITLALKMKNMQKRYKTFNKAYAIDTLMPLFKQYDGKSDKETVEIDGHCVTIQSQRYDLFKKEYSETGSCKCIECGLEANVFLMQQSMNDTAGSPWHFNLYRIDGESFELFTKDHIIPKSRGGKNEQENYQLMCASCNKKKGQELPTGIPEHEYPVIEGKASQSKTKRRPDLPIEVQVRQSMLSSGITEEMIDSVVPGSTWIRFVDRSVFMLTVHENNGSRIIVTENDSIIKPLTQEWKLSTFCREMKFNKIVSTSKMDINDVYEKLDKRLEMINAEIQKLEAFKKELSGMV